MDQAKLDHADALEAEAKALRAEAYTERPMPDFWRIGQKVRFLRSSDFAWNEGDVWTIIGFRDEPNKPAREYQVFYTQPPSGKGQYWTTPNDVELAEDLRKTPAE